MITGIAGVPPAMSAKRESVFDEVSSEMLRACGGALRAGRPRSQQRVARNPLPDPLLQFKSLDIRMRIAFNR